MSFANAAMLFGLAGVAIPLVIHLLSRRRAPTIDWGAMQFLDLGPGARTRTRLAEWLLMATRMLLLALAALAAARPIWSLGAGPAGGERGGPRDVVIVVDGSAGMARVGGGSSPMAEAIRRAEAIVDRLGPADAAAVVRAGDRAAAALDPPSADRGRIRAALRELPSPRGSADLPAALGEAFRILEGSAAGRSTEVVVLTDGGRAAWRPDDLGRWRLLRALHARLPSPPRITVEAFEVPTDPGSADGRVTDVRASRRLVAPGGSVRVGATIRNLGPATLERTAELRIDGEPVPGSARVVGPLPPGGSAAVEFRAAPPGIGPRAVSVRLAPGGTPDPLPINDEAWTVIEVAEALPVLLVDGDPGSAPMTGEVDFLRAALMPTGDEAPRIRASVIPPAELDAARLEGQRVLVLANVDRPGPDASAAVAAWVDRGGGVLVAPGDRTDLDAWDRDAWRDGLGWLPARIGPLRGRFADRSPVARPSPSSFTGPVLGAIGREGGSPLGSAALFAYFVLEPAAGPRPASVLGRLDTGDPWLVERPSGSGRAAILAGPIDAEGGTLPVNPDFVPFAHELIAHLAGPGPDASATPPGSPIDVPIDPPPPEAPAAVPVRTPSGRPAEAVVGTGADGPFARLDDPDEPGLYRFDLPGGPAYRLVASADPEPDPDPAPLSPAEAAALAEGWPLTFTAFPPAEAAAGPASPSDPDRDSPGGARRPPRPLWRTLLLAAMACLCVEVWLTRRLALRRGPSESAAHDGSARTSPPIGVG